MFCKPKLPCLYTHTNTSLFQEGRGRGTTDGLFKSQRHFKCDPNCGLFVALEKLRPYEEKKDEKETADENLLTKVKHKIVEGFSNLSNMVLQAEQPNEENCSKLEDKATGHKVEDRVWVYIGDKLCGGYLKYIGRVPGGRGETLAGIYMVSIIVTRFFVLGLEVQYWGVEFV